MSKDLYKSTIVEAINEINRTANIISIKSLLSYSFMIIDDDVTYNIIKVSQVGIRKNKIIKLYQKSFFNEV